MAARTDRRLGRALGWAAGVTVLLLLLGLSGVGWYYSNQVLAVAPPVEPLFDLTVERVEEGMVALSGPEADRPGHWGLDLAAGGYARVGDVTSRADEIVLRPVHPLPDLPSAGDRARLHAYAYPDDLQVLGPEIDAVDIDGPLGTYPAYHAPADDDTWVVFVHGRGADRTEAFRMVPSVVEAGHPALVITHRNDPEAPASPDGRYRLGWTEWEDVAAAVDWARMRGAEDVVLYGLSTGGSIVGRYLDEVDEAGVAAVVLDAPVLDWSATLRLAAIDRGVPAWLTPVAQSVITLRTGIRWGRLDLLARADELGVPILLFHGDADATVPVASSDALARARPDLVRYVRVPGAGHVAAWNHAPDAYEAEVRSFLDEVAR